MALKFNKYYDQFENISPSEGEAMMGKCKKMEEKNEKKMNVWFVYQLRQWPVATPGRSERSSFCKSQSLVPRSFFLPPSMPARPAPGSQEGYPSSSSPPSVDAHHNDPFSPPPQAAQFDSYYGRRDAYPADATGHHNLHHDQQYYDQNAPYDPYSAYSFP